jgi:plastocyanin
MNWLAPIAAAFCLCAAGVKASDVSGEITLDTRMVKKSLPPAVYDLRGIALHDKPSPVATPGGLGRVAVWLEGDSSVPVPVTATMQQHDRHFEPDLLMIPAGSKVLFPNLDPIFHNIFSLSRTQQFDLGYYAEGKSREVLFSRQGIVQVYCHIHPEMYGVIVVTSSRWTARPASDGTFSWANVPPGKYRVMVWQRSAGLIHKAISVPAAGSVHVKFELPKDDSDR